MSSGISKSLNQDIQIESNVESSSSISVGGAYSLNRNPFTVYENGVDVTNAATKSTSITDPNGGTVSSISNAIEGTYTITYTIKYAGKTKTATTQVTVSPAVG